MEFEGLLPTFRNKPPAMKTKAAAKEKRTPAKKSASNVRVKKNGSNGHDTDSLHADGHAISSDQIGSKELLRVLTEVKNGNFSVRMPIDEVGLNGKIYDTLNEIISLNEKMMQEFTRAGNTIGKQGKLTQRIEIPSTKGAWSEGVNSLNVLISDLVHPTIEIAHVISSVAKGNLSQEMPE